MSNGQRIPESIAATAEVPGDRPGTFRQLDDNWLISESM